MQAILIIDKMTDLLHNVWENFLLFTLMYVSSEKKVDLKNMLICLSPPQKKKQASPYLSASKNFKNCSAPTF